LPPPAGILEANTQKSYTHRSRSAPASDFLDSDTCSAAASDFPDAS
jgi:hypothetical protein